MSFKKGATIKDCPYLTAYQNVALMVDYLGWPTERIDKRVTKLAQLTQLPLDMLSRFPTQLSGGQRLSVLSWCLILLFRKSLYLL
jgi:osmoprotectant transport system ATP-binding protein